MKPTATTSGKQVQLRYELPQRIYDAKIYPVKAPNGSTIVIYGHGTGVGILWRGGRPLKQSTAPPPKPAAKPPGKVNGTSSDVVMIIDSDDDAPAKSAPQPPPEAEFEDEEEELDPDQPYPSIIQHLRLALNTEVLHIAIPQIPVVSALRSADTIPAIFSKNIVFTVACADYGVRVITLPLNPPSNDAKETSSGSKSQFGEVILRIPNHAGHQSIPKGVTMTWTARNEPRLGEQSDDDMDVDAEEDTTMTPRRRNAKRRQSRSRSGRRGGAEGYDLLVASHSAEIGGLLKIWRFELTETAVKASNPFAAYQSLTLRKPATRIAFNTAQYPKRRHSQLLITDSSGIARIYDPFATASRKRQAGGNTEPGSYVALFRTTFEPPQSNVPGPPVLTSRKSIIDATWASDGHSILAILADGEWGVWDVDRSGPKPPSDPSAFSIRGYVGTRESTRVNEKTSSPKKNSRSSLVPMTPNTRKTKEEHLFHGASSNPSTPTKGGVSVASLPPINGSVPEDSVVVWYGSDVYRIPNLAQFWGRAASAGDNSLSRPTMSKVHGITLFGEAINSVGQFETTAKDVRLAIPRDILFTTDHRLLITTNATQLSERDLNVGFEREQAEEEETRRFDRAMLARGELDLGGMDRLLEDMEGSGTRSTVLGNPRKVLFASSTS
jgi:hypothetical protein